MDKTIKIDFTDVIGSSRIASDISGSFGMLDSSLPELASYERSAKISARANSMDKTKYEYAISLVRQGKKYSDISLVIGISPALISKWVSLAGLEVKLGPRQKPLTERFWKYVNKNGPVPDHMPHLGNCWVWTGAIFRNNGRGKLQLRELGKVKLASHVAWFLETNRWPKLPLLICHHCDNPLCVRFDHLFEGTKSDNALDAIRKGRWR